MAVLLAAGAVLASGAQAMSIDAPDGSEDAPITFSVSGSSVADAWLYVYVEKAHGLGCAFSASIQEVSSGPPDLATATGPGAFEYSGEYEPKGPGKFVICAYLTTTKPSIPIDTASVTLRVASGKAYTPELKLPRSGSLSYERPPTLVWDKGPGKDILRIYRGTTTRNRYPMAQLRVRSGYRAGFSLGRGSGTWRARLNRRVAYGAYSWTVTRRDPRVGTERTTSPRRFRVGPSPLRRLVVKLRTHQYASIKRPGVSKVTIRSAPYARVRVRLLQNGHAVSSRSFKEDRFRPVTRMSFSWRCARTGAFKLKVAARDRYGHHRLKTVRWKVSASRCAEMKRAAEARRKAKEQPSNNESDGSCTPGYSPCLPPASDYDCAGGSGDGPKYVSGPVYVTGSDPYGLDSDGDGIVAGRRIAGWPPYFS